MPPEFTWLAALLQMAGAPRRKLIEKVFQPEFLINYEEAFSTLDLDSLSELESALECASRAMSKVNGFDAVKNMHLIYDVLREVKSSILAITDGQDK